MATSDTLAAHKTPARPQASASVAVRWWLFAVAVLVIAMVTIGGATRLTGSGLSITEWKPIMGAVPPLSAADWHEAFEKYKQIPQYHQVNKGMSLEAFKSIFWWEWGHRFLARLVGVAFLVPFLAFLALGRIRRSLVPRMVGLFTLGGLQGAIGWYMVASGLSERVSVSQYRLALHLGLAFVILGALIWTALSLDDDGDEARPASPLWGSGVLLLGLSFLQVELGALVAGMKAGLTYNTWPLMDGRFIPNGLFVMTPWYVNPFENATAVQFNHRIVAYVLTLAVGVHLWRLLRAGPTPAQRLSGLVLVALTVAQVLLGIWTLLAVVPLSLGLLHQFGAAVLFCAVVWHLHALRA